MNAISDAIVATGEAAPSVIMATGMLSLLGLLLWAAWSDVRRRRIPNVLVFGGAGLALLLHLVLPPGFGFHLSSPIPGGLGALAALKGLAIGLGSMLPLYVFRALGAGDVKLMAMVGAFLGPDEVIPAIVASFLVGGAISIALAFRAGVAQQLLRNLAYMARLSLLKSAMSGTMVIEPPPRSVGNMPFGVAISLGTVIAMTWTKLGASGLSY